MPAPDHEFELELGMILDGSKASYRITNKLGAGAWGETYCAEVAQARASSGTLNLGTKVVIKIPTLDRHRSFDDQLARMTQIQATLLREYMGHERLADLPCVATILDIGLHQVPLANSIAAVPAMFVVQRRVTGLVLREYMRGRSEYLVEGEFRGIPDSAAYLAWARMLACALLQVHRRLVVHGDIWPNNVMVDLSRPDAPYPVLIDFGLAVLRDLAAGIGGNLQSPHPYLAPEGGGWVGSDIYALGGVLFYLATGQDPPSDLRNIQDNDALKTRVAAAIQPLLLAANCGIADIIARCLRCDPQSRVPHADAVLQDIETFIYGGTENAELPPRPCGVCEASCSTASLHHDCLPEALAALPDNPLFHRMAQVRSRLLLRDLEDMRRGVFDLVGDHDEIVGALSQYLSVLGKGDRYLTLSLPSFWRAPNLGINGRFLSINHLVAQKQAIVQRVFLLTKDETQYDEIKRIIGYHRAVMAAVGPSSLSEQAERGGYHAAIKIVDGSEREKLVRENRHFGLLSKGGQTVLLFPLYRSDGILSAIQFRTAIDASDFQAFFETILSGAVPLTSWPLDAF